MATSPPRQPDPGSLHAAALTHLARFAATEAGLTRILARKVDRWARLAQPDPEAVVATHAAIPGIVARLAASGALSDEAFAHTRARALARAGRSRRAIGAHLASRGVAHELAATASPENPGQELAAALIHARKRRLGPWRRAAPAPATAPGIPPETQRRELGSLARAGFAQSIARQALAMTQDEAETLIIAFRAAL